LPAQQLRQQSVAQGGEVAQGLVAVVIQRSNSGLATSANGLTNAVGGRITWVSSTIPSLMFCWAEPCHW